VGSTAQQMSNSTEEQLPVRQLASRVVYENNWMSVREDEVEFADGARSIYGVVDKSDFAVVIAEEDGAFHLVEQYRYAVRKRSLEFPMGGWPVGKSGTALELAQAELAEETGYTASSWRHLGYLHQSIGYSSQGFDVFHATGLTPGDHRRESTESDMVHLVVSEERFRHLILSGGVMDSPSIAAYGLLSIARSY
jgi:8-oxo-dGTP pyrophosphatase MutT (NUDIX family)